MGKREKAGTTYITATVNKKSIRCKVTVKEIKLNKSVLTLAQYYSTKLKVVGTTEKVQWSSSSLSIATVDKKGKITAKKPGAVIIKAKVGGKNLKCKVTVTEPKISSTSVNKIIGNTYQLQVYGTNGKVKWTSENTAIATVSSSGKVKAKGCGSTNIVAKVDGTTLKCKFTTEPVPQLQSTYYISGIGCYALANSVVHVKKENECDDLNVGTLEEVGDISEADYSDGKTYPVFETYWYRNEGFTRETPRYIDVYLIGTSQRAIVTSTTKYSSKLKVQYIPKDGYGIIRIYSPNGTEGIVTVKVDGYTYRIATDTRNRGHYIRSIDPEPTDYPAQATSAKEVIATYSCTFLPFKTLKVLYNQMVYIDRCVSEWLESIFG